jgi:hypothetical protein
MLATSWLSTPSISGALVSLVDGVVVRVELRGRRLKDAEGADEAGPAAQAHQVGTLRPQLLHFEADAVHRRQVGVEHGAHVLDGRQRLVVVTVRQLRVPLGVDVRHVDAADAAGVLLVVVTQGLVVDGLLGDPLGDVDRVVALDVGGADLAVGELQQRLGG